MKATLGHVPATLLRSADERESDGALLFRAAVAATSLGAAAGLVMIGIVIWGLWVAADFVRHANTSIVGAQQHKLNAAIFLLTWLLIFGPFLFFGIMILRSTFAREKRECLVSLRVFTSIASLRARAEMQRRKFFKNSPQKCIDLPPDSVRESQNQ